MASLYPYICFIVLISLLMRVEGQAGRLAHDEGEGFVSSLIFTCTHAVSGFQIIF